MSYTLFLRSADFIVFGIPQWFPLCMMCMNVHCPVSRSPDSVGVNCYNYVVCDVYRSYTGLNANLLFVKILSGPFRFLSSKILRSR